MPRLKNGNKGERDNLLQRGNSWYVRIWVDGREIWRSAGRSKQAAQTLLVKMREDAERGHLGLPRKSVVTVKEQSTRYLDWAKQHKRSWKRDQQSLKFLLPVFGHLRLIEVNKARVEAYQRDRATDKVKGATINREVACLRKLLSHAVELGLLETNPLAGVRMLPESPPRQPILEVVDEAKLLEASVPWLRIVLRLAVLTGCREAELVALRWRHVDFDGGEIIVEDSKSGDSRRVPVHPVVLEELRAMRTEPDDHVIRLKSGDVPTPNSVSRAFKRAARKIGRDELRFHDLRHVAGTRLLATGANLPEVATFLGHKTLVIARRYAHTTRTRLRALVGAMEVTGQGAPVEPKKEGDDGKEG